MARHECATRNARVTVCLQGIGLRQGFSHVPVQVVEEGINAERGVPWVVPAVLHAHVWGRLVSAAGCAPQARDAVPSHANQVSECVAADRCAAELPTCAFPSLANRCMLYVYADERLGARGNLLFMSALPEHA